jgi:DNA end-binding protein Ku
MKVQPDLLQLAEHILKSKAASFDPSQFTDRYEQAVLEVLKKKQEGLPTERPAALVPPRNVVNLFDALRASLAMDKANAPTAKAVPAKGGKKAAKRNPDQREMLLPIAGSGKGKAVAKEAPAKPAKSTGQRKAG